MLEFLKGVDSIKPLSYWQSVSEEPSVQSLGHPLWKKNLLALSNATSVHHFEVGTAGELRKRYTVGVGSRLFADVVTLSPSSKKMILLRNETNFMIYNLSKNKFYLLASIVPGTGDADHKALGIEGPPQQAFITTFNEQSLGSVLFVTIQGTGDHISIKPKDSNLSYLEMDIQRDED